MLFFFGIFHILQHNPQPTRMNPTLKKIGIVAILVLLAIAAFFYFKSKRTSSYEAMEINPAFGEYIASYTSGVISANGKLRIILTNPVGDSAEIGKEISAKLFDFSPSISGKTYWLDNRTIEFRPNEKMRSGQVLSLIHI